mgnify:CR=1 FL=1
MDFLCPIPYFGTSMPYASILITGGTGSFGVAFTRFALLHGLTDRLVIYSRDELKQFEMRATFQDDRRIRWFLGDVRDKDRLRRACQGVEAAIHAAALKHVDALEYNPGEAVKTNILGTTNLIEAATDAGVRRVIALSTDKACGPVNAYGASKLMVERLMAAAHTARGRSGPIFAATRYGNVAGSRGSVIPRWLEAINLGQPLHLTDPAMTRFWMTLDEAVTLVAWTLAHANGGELVVPSLPAYQLGDLAVAVGPKAQGWEEFEPRIVRTGLRAGEKMHESMISPDEAPLFEAEGQYFIRRETPPSRGLEAPITSDRAPRLSVGELAALVKRIPTHEAPADR